MYEIHIVSIFMDELSFSRDKPKTLSVISINKKTKNWSICVPWKYNFWNNVDKQTVNNDCH